MANSKNSGQGKSRSMEVSAPHLPAGPLPNKYMHKLGRTNIENNPYGTGDIAKQPGFDKRDKRDKFRSD